MSGTKRLRELLDERGVEWGSGFGGDTLWTGRHGIEWRWDKQEDTLAMYSHKITPEQAIAATLGNGECELEPIPSIVVTINMLNEIGWGKCSECGHATPDESNYCQNCGRKVVE